MTAQPTYLPAPQLAPAPAAAPGRRRTGRVIGFLAAPLVVGGIGAGVLFAFGPRTVDPASVEGEIVRITQTALQVTPADVRCPEGIAVQAGGVFTCTGTVDGQPVTWWARQDDDRGELTITYDRLLRLDSVEQTVARRVSADLEVPVTVDCAPAGRAVLRNTPGQEIDCTATNASDPTDGAKLVVTVDADGAAAYRFA